MLMKPVIHRTHEASFQPRHPKRLSQTYKQRRADLAPNPAASGGPGQDSTHSSRIGSQPQAHPHTDLHQRNPNPSTLEPAASAPSQSRRQASAVAAVAAAILGMAAGAGAERSAAACDLPALFAHPATAAAPEAVTLSDAVDIMARSFRGPPLEGPGSSPYFVASRAKHEGCVFCKLAEASHLPGSGVLFQNDRLFVVPDLRPSAVCHLLVIPREHIANTSSVGRADAPLLAEMLRLGRQEVARLQAEGGVPQGTTKFGYHQPPYRSVDHLHQHCFVLPHTPWWKAWKYSVPTVWISATRLLARWE